MVAATVVDPTGADVDAGAVVNGTVDAVVVVVVVDVEVDVVEEPSLLLWMMLE